MEAISVGSRLTTASLDVTCSVAGRQPAATAAGVTLCTSTAAFFDPAYARAEHADATEETVHRLIVDVYQSAKDIVEWAMPRLTRGGVVVFDDYGFRNCEGVTTLVK